MKKALILIIVIAVVISAVVIIVNMARRPALEPQLNVANVTPAPNSQNIALDTNIAVRFDRVISEDYLALLAVDIQPKTNFQLKPDSAGVLQITHAPLIPKTTYTVSLSFIQKPLFSWRFTTLEVKSQADPGLMEEIKKQIKTGFPLADYLPTNARFEIRYINDLTLYIIQNGATQEEVLNWIRSKNVDPATHEIIWIE